MAVKERVEWIDLVRAIAILTVLFVHASDGIYILNANDAIQLTMSSRLFEYVALFIGRIGVPFFLMITGFLLLDRSYSDEKTQKFWRINCKNLIIVTVIWTIIYALSIYALVDLSSGVDVTEAGNLFFSHMWYMPMIIGMYISIPFVASALDGFDEKTINMALIVFAIMAFIVPFLSVLADMNGIKDFSIQFSLGFSGGVYGIYIILGYLVKKDYFKKYSSKLIALFAIVSFVMCVLFEYYSFIRGYDFFLWYDFPFILTGSYALFELCSRIKHVKNYRLVHFLSKYSFAVFLIHNLFRLPLLPIFADSSFSQPVKAILLWILLIILSYIAAVIIYRIPKVGKFILYMR